MSTSILQRGGISILVLTFGVVAVVLIGGLATITGVNYKFSERSYKREQALAVAEAGIDYYRWHLAHDPNDYQDGTGASGPYVHDFSDPASGLEGTFSLEISPPSSESAIATITSTGWLDNTPSVTRKVQATFGSPSLSQYAFLHNSNVWFGQGITINGPVQSNGGIRMDGINTSTLSTSKETYTCGVESGCDEAGETKPGIWGNGGPQELWDFPVTTVDFASINVDFSTLRDSAQSDGVYLPHSGSQGYHIVFQSDATVDIYRVDETDFYKGWSQTYACQNLYQIIDDETLISTHNMDDAIVIFAEDTLWVEGTLKGVTTVAAARFPLASYQYDIWIPNNLVYEAKDGTNKLGMIAQRDIIFTKDVPDTFEIDGAFLAHSSRVLRHHYNYHGCKQGNPENKNELIIYGSVISNLISYWNFGGGGGESPTSGFVKRTINHDPNLTYDPPPYFPSSGKVEMLSWDELK